LAALLEVPAWSAVAARPALRATALPSTSRLARFITHGIGVSVNGNRNASQANSPLRGPEREMLGVRSDLAAPGSGRDVRPAVTTQLADQLRSDLAQDRPPIESIIPEQGNDVLADG
jgi:hypothetical protein